jgi:hypothetical protein
VDREGFLNDVVTTDRQEKTPRPRPFLTGLCLTLGEALEVAAAAGFRLAWRTLPIEFIATEAQPPREIVPAEAFNVLTRLWKRVAATSFAFGGAGTLSVCRLPA